MLTILLFVGMEVVDDLTHTFEGEIVWIESENPSLIHVVWGEGLTLRLERITDNCTNISPHGLEGDSSFGVFLDYVGDSDIV